MSDIRMDAYYYGFALTGERSIDVVLSAIACAGKAYHHTQDWNDECGPYEPVHHGKTPIEWIQNAAADAAATIARLEAEVERLGAVARSTEDARIHETKRLEAGIARLASSARVARAALINANAGQYRRFPMYDHAIDAIDAALATDGSAKTG